MKSPDDLALAIVAKMSASDHGSLHTLTLEYQSELAAHIKLAIAQERARADRYRVALEFYADFNSWLPDDDYCNYLKIVSSDREKRPGDKFPEYPHDNVIGGKLARKALEEDE